MEDRRKIINFIESKERLFEKQTFTGKTHYFSRKHCFMIEEESDGYYFCCTSRRAKVYGFSFSVFKKAFKIFDNSKKELQGFVLIKESVKEIDNMTGDYKDLKNY
jgi:hypothetical protein